MVLQRRVPSSVAEPPAPRLLLVDKGSQIHVRSQEHSCAG